MKVLTYRNLHKKCWSVMDSATRKVIRYAEALLILDATFVVRPAGRAKVLREKRKNVHAFVKGTLAPKGYPVGREFWKSMGKITYNPYKAGYFRDENDREVISAEAVLLDRFGVFASKITRRPK